MSISNQPFRTLLVGLILIILASVLCGCKTLNESHIDNEFPGIQQAMEKPIVCLLFVHGMGGYSNSNPIDPGHLIDAIGKMPNMKQTRAESDVQFADPDTAGKLKRQDFQNTATGHELRIYTLDWEPVTTPIKTAFLGYDQDKKFTSQRLPLVNDLRSGILDDGIPDVVLYAGQYKRAMQRTIKQALRQIHHELEDRPDQENDYEFVFVTWSLGSKIIFDCLADPNISATEPADPAESADYLTFNKIAEKTFAVYMLANQVPLLTLADVKSPRRTNEPPTTMPYENLRSVARRRKQAVATQPNANPLTIVAFSDPNDLLSYPLPDWLENTHDARFANVSSSVARTAYFIPFVGWVMNPVTAHTGYGIDDRVVNLILHGQTTPPPK